MSHCHSDSFDNFVPGPGNRAAVAAISDLTFRDAFPGSQVIIDGPEGVGKSHLLRACTNEITRRQPWLNLCQESAEKLYRRVRNAKAEGTMAETMRRYTSLDVYLLDDIQFLARHKEPQEFLVELAAQMRARQNKLLVIAGTMKSAMCSTLDTALGSLLRGGQQITISHPEQATRVRILMEHAERYGLRLTSDIAEEIAAKKASNVRQLINAITILQAHQRVSAEPLTTSVARGQLRGI